jgi:hypothetical protein
MAAGAKAGEKWQASEMEFPAATEIKMLSALAFTKMSA